MRRSRSTSVAPRWLCALLAVAVGAAVSATAAEYRPLPSMVIAQAPGIRPLGRARHSWLGVKMYEATLWIVGPQWSPSQPHALDLEPARNVTSDTLASNAIAEMKALKLADDGKLKVWRAEMVKLVPDLKTGNQAVIFCAPGGQTVLYLNGNSLGEVNDTSLCPAIMNVWLHPQTRRQSQRKGLLGQ